MAEATASAALQTIAQLMAGDRSVTGVVVNGPQRVFIERPTGHEPADFSFRDDQQVVEAIQELSACVGRSVGEVMPCISAGKP